MDDNPVDVEIVKEKQTAIERAAEAGELLSLHSPEMDVKQLEKMVNERVDFYRKVALISLKLTSVHDWVDENGKPFLQASGAKKLMKIWGAKISSMRMEIETDKGTGLPLYRFWGRAQSDVLKVDIEVLGGRNANDSFFTSQTKLDLLDVQKAAYNNFIGRAIKAVIGLDNLTWEEIEEMTSNRITKAKATGKVTYKTGTQESQKVNTAPQGQQSSQNGQPTQTTQQTQGKASGDVISEAQGKRFYAIAKGAGWSDQEIKDYLKREYGIEHSRDIKKSDYEKICAAIQSKGSY